MTTYIIDSYRAGAQFINKDGDRMTTEQVRRYRHFDEVDDAIAEVTRRYRIQLDGGHAAGGSDNISFFDDELISLFKKEAEEEGTNESYDWYTVPGWYEGGNLVETLAQIEAGVDSFRSDVTTTHIVQIEEEEA